MFILQLEYTVNDYGAWKKLFDSDPAGRERAGVRRFRVMRSTDNPNLVMVDLEFDQRGQAEKLLTNLKPVWDRAISQRLLENPQGHIVEVVETKELVTA